MSTPKPVLAVRDLSKRYGELEVVRGVSFAIAPGECFGLLGPNGAGKTTTLMICLGLTHADAGTIELAGHAIPADARAARELVGVVPQFDNLDPDFTVEENLLVFARYFGMRAANIRARVPELLAFAGLEGRARAPLATLSGGMKRRLTLARALVNDPAIVFLDEPTTGLDPQARHVIWERLRQLAARGKTLVLTTHFMDEAERLCDRVAVLDAGRIIATGAPRALIAEHIEPQVVEIYGDGASRWAEAHVAGTTLASRTESVGETVFCYAANAEPLLAQLQHSASLRYLHRPANLEDLFLKLTGRELRD